MDRELGNCCICLLLFWGRKTFIKLLHVIKKLLIWRYQQQHQVEIRRRFYEWAACWLNYLWGWARHSFVLRTPFSKLQKLLARFPRADQRCLWRYPCLQFIDCLVGINDSCWEGVSLFWSQTESEHTVPPAMHFLLTTKNKRGSNTTCKTVLEFFQSRLWWMKTAQQQAFLKNKAFLLKAFFKSAVWSKFLKLQLVGFTSIILGPLMQPYFFGRFYCRNEANWFWSEKKQAFLSSCRVRSGLLHYHWLSTIANSYPISDPDIRFTLNLAWADSNCWWFDLTSLELIHIHTWIVAESWLAD